MSRRRLSQRAQIGGAVAAIVVPVAGALAVLGQRGPALVFGGLAVLGYLLWRRSDSRRDLKRPLVVDLEGRAVKQESAERSARRIRIHNRSPSRTLRSVRVELLDLAPQRADFLPLELERTNGGAQPFELAPGTEEYLELVSRSAGSDQFVLGYGASHAEPGASNLVPAEPLDLVVRVSAEEVAAEQYLFSVAADRRGRLQLAEINAPSQLALETPRAAKSQPVGGPTQAPASAVAALGWLTDGSAWGRWQKAAHRKLSQQVGTPAGFREENLMHLATSMIDEAARTGKIELWGLPAGKAEFELIEPASWQLRSRLRLARDQQQHWQVRLGVSPQESSETAALVKGYESLAVDMEAIKRLWPEYDLLTDNLTKGLNRELRQRVSPAQK